MERDLRAAPTEPFLRNRRCNTTLEHCNQRSQIHGGRAPLNPAAKTFARSNSIALASASDNGAPVRMNDYGRGWSCNSRNSRRMNTGVGKFSETCRSHTP